MRRCPNSPLLPNEPFQNLVECGRVRIPISQNTLLLRAREYLKRNNPLHHTSGPVDRLSLLHGDFGVRFSTEIRPNQEEDPEEYVAVVQVI